MRLALLVAALAFAGPARAQSVQGWPPPIDAVLADSLAGCYQIDAALWPDSLAHLPSPDRLPEWVELSTEPTALPPPLPRDAVGLSVEYPPEAAYFPFAFWLAYDGGVRLDSASPASLRIAARPTGRGVLSGTVTGGTDLIYYDKPTQGSVAVRLIRIGCSPL